MARVNYIIERDTCYLYKAPQPDTWGILIPSETKQELKGMIRETEELVTLTFSDNKVVIPQFKVTFNGDKNITSADLLEIYGEKYQVLKVQKIKDLSGAVLLTKVTL